MLNRERELQILDILKQHGSFVKVNTLCEQLFASDSSVRRDLKKLEKRGLIRRNYGGAEIINNYSSVETFERRTHQNTLEKKLIAQKAVSLINNRDIIFLDQSSTAFYLALELVDKSNITVVTNNVEILSALSYSSLTVISSGGTLCPTNRNCLLGNNAIKTFEEIYANKVFFSAKGLSEDGVITDCSIEEIALRKAMLKNAKQKIFLCDSSKYGVVSGFIQCDYKDVDYIISDKPIKLKVNEDLANKIL